MEKSWVELEDMLRKAISRLSTTAKGIDPQLDQVLSDIQTHTRNKKDDALKQDLERLAQVIIRMDEKSTAKAQQHNFDTDISHDVDDTSFTLALIDQLQGKPEQQSQIDELRANLPGLQHDKWLSELAQLINRLLQIDASENEDKSQTFEVLITLIEKITLAYGNTAELDTLTEQLENAGADDDWRDFLDRIIKQIRIIISGINNEKIELEGLIVDVTRQLGEISSALNDEHQDSLQGRKETRQLQDVMNQSVNDIQQKVLSETDIQVLKSSIGHNLQSIKSSLQEFVSHDAERFKKAEQRNLKLQQQIQYMEQESDQLKQKLSENRQKLMFDSLTGVRNRLSYEEILEQELSRYARYREVFCYALLDIDHFKRINDEYGHNAGDKALQIVARMLAQNIRKTDFLFRIGGEEFVLLLPKTSLENAAPLVEKIRKSVGQANFHFKQQKVTISLSAGVSNIAPGDNAESIYERADQALYQAKNTGRDRMLVARSS